MKKKEKKKKKKHEKIEKEKTIIKKKSSCCALCCSSHTQSPSVCFWSAGAAAGVALPSTDSAQAVPKERLSSASEGTNWSHRRCVSRVCVRPGATESKSACVHRWQLLACSLSTVLPNTLPWTEFVGSPHATPRRPSSPVLSLVTLSVFDLFVACLPSHGKSSEIPPDTATCPCLPSPTTGPHGKSSVQFF